VTLEDEAGKTYRYRLVGPDEFDAEPDYISIDSPMARALLKKQQDDEIHIVQGDVENAYYITSISYETATG
jgi:transcription elongation factor GreB